MKSKIKEWIFRCVRTDFEAQLGLIGMLQEENKQLKEEIQQIRTAVFERFDIHQEHNHKHLCAMQEQINKEFGVTSGMKRSLTLQKKSLTALRQLVNRHGEKLVDADKEFSDIEVFLNNSKKKFGDVEKSLKTVKQYESKMQELIQMQTHMKEMAEDSIKNVKAHEQTISAMHQQFKQAMAIQCKSTVGELQTILANARK